MTEVEKIAYAKMYIEKLANGINPLTNQRVPDGEVINHVEIARCLFYVSHLLGKMAEDARAPRSRKKPAKIPFYLDEEARKSFEYSETPISISVITQRLNDLIREDGMAKINYKSIQDWIIELGFLETVTDEAGKIKRQPTCDGIKNGLTLAHRQSLSGPYTVVVYDKNAQQFILDHLDAIVERSRKRGN